MPKLTVKRLKELTRYNPDTGVFSWAKSRVGCREGDRAGAIKVLGKLPYWVIGVDNKRYKAARLAWFYMTGKWPNPEVDHINRNSTDDRFINLREATRSQQLVNTGLRSDSSSGERGVSWFAKAKKWRAYLHLDGRFVHLGLFETKEEAVLVVKSARKEHYGEFAP